MSFLLDANALIALCWEHHEHHAAVLAWFRNRGSAAWSSCAFTQAAFVRVSLQPAFSGVPVRAAEVIEVLVRTTAHSGHRYLPVDFDISAVRRECTGAILGHRQITDAWLLTTAIMHRVKLATFDAGIAALLANAGERAKHLELLEARPPR